MNREQEDLEQLKYIQEWLNKKKLRKEYRQLAMRQMKYHFHMIFYWIIEFFRKKDDER